MSSLPKFLEKFNIFGKLGGAIAMGAIGFAIDSIISTIVGAIAKSSLQDMIQQSLDYRFKAEKSLRVI